jgi:4-diphosphocytidyl-2-C-methyl-D-erythritol kinase
MTTRSAPAKVNLALVVGGPRPDGKHELVTLYERIDLVDDVTLEPSSELRVEGYTDDTIVTHALIALGRRVDRRPNWRVTIEKRIPVAAGLGGGSSDAAAALLLAGEALGLAADSEELHGVAREVGSDVPFFLAPGPQLGEGDGTSLTAVELPRDYSVLLLLPHGAIKQSTADVYASFDATHGEATFEARRAALLAALDNIKDARDLAALPRNDLATSRLASEIERAGAFRADVTGAGPGLYGLFDTEADARRASADLSHLGQTWVAFPSWYG